MSVHVPYHQPSVMKALELVQDIPLNDQEAKFKAITKYAERFFVYDYIRAIEIPKKNALPDVNRCWKRGMGICMDLASMVTGMLRAVGIKAWLCYGYVNRKTVDGPSRYSVYHAWVEASVNGQTLVYDHKRHTGTKTADYCTCRRF